MRVVADALVVRTGHVLAPDDRDYGFGRALVALAAGARVTLPTDHLVSPCFAADFVDPLLDMLVDEESGIWHASHGPALSSFDLARSLAHRVGVPTRRLEASSGAARPHALASERAWPLRDLDRALTNHVAAWTFNLRAAAA